MWGGGDQSGSRQVGTLLPCAVILCALFSRLPFCVLGGWGRAEDETLQIFTTWITKYLNFITELSPLLV